MCRHFTLTQPSSHLTLTLRVKDEEPETEGFGLQSHLAWNKLARKHVYDGDFESN